MNRVITAAPVRKTLRVEAPQVRAFEVFTSRMGAWWPKTHSINKATVLKDVVVEPRTGGKWFERGEDGSECKWGDVLAWEPPGRVLLSWHLNSKFAIDPTMKSEIEVRFTPEGAHATRVELEHRITAIDAEAVRTSVDSPGGWTELLASFARVAAKT